MCAFAAPALLLGRPAAAHDYEIHLLAPGPGWCEALRGVAEPGDVVEFAPGLYAGPCDIGTGGLVEKNEPLVLRAATESWPVFEPGPHGLTVSGAATRLYHLEVHGDVSALAERITLDTLIIDGDVVATGERFQLLYTTLLGTLQQSGSLVILRGNTVMAPSDVNSELGFIADNTFDGASIFRTERFVRNLVRAEAEVHGAVAANVFTAPVLGSGAFVGNTALATVLFDGTTVNNATTHVDLGAVHGNLMCDGTCFADLDALDLAPAGPLLGAAVLTELAGDGDFCGRARSDSVGALEDEVSPGMLTALTKERARCLLPEVPPPAVHEPETPVTRGCAVLPMDSGFSVLALLGRRR